MTKFRMLLSSLFVLLVLAAVPSAARAFDGWNGQLWNVPVFGYSGSLYGLGYMPVPPYYAIHPPVYYGERYYRTYGESPFARPSRSSRPERISAQVIINPFVTPAPPAVPSLEVPQESTDLQAAPPDATAQPQVILNPYCESDTVAQR